MGGKPKTSTPADKRLKANGGNKRKGKGKKPRGGDEDTVK